MSCGIRQREPELHRALHAFLSLQPGPCNQDPTSGSLLFATIPACSCNVDATNHTELAGKFKPYVIKTLPLRCARGPPTTSTPVSPCHASFQHSNSTRQPTFLGPRANARPDCE